MGGSEWDEILPFIQLYKNIQISKTRNIPKAPSFDSVLFHKDLVEMYQYKSSEYISSGQPPSIKQYNCIDVKTLIDEYEKAIKSKEFFGERFVKLILISNKPFWNYSIIKKEKIIYNKDHS